MEDCTPCKCTCHNGATCCAECYKKHKEPPYVVGDRLEITITGTVTTGNNNGDTLDLKLDDSVVSMYFSGYRGEVTGWAANSKIRKFPPPEPKGPGAVVHLGDQTFVKVANKWYRNSDGMSWNWAELTNNSNGIIIAQQGIGDGRN